MGKKKGRRLGGLAHSAREMRRRFSGEGVEHRSLGLHEVFTPRGENAVCAVPISGCRSLSDWPLTTSHPVNGEGSVQQPEVVRFIE